jgi:hypothetical protein
MATTVRPRGKMTRPLTTPYTVGDVVMLTTAIEPSGRCAPGSTPGLASVTSPRGDAPPGLRSPVDSVRPRLARDSVGVADDGDGLREWQP